MSDDQNIADRSTGRLGRRSFLVGAAGLGAVAAFPAQVLADPVDAADMAVSRVPGARGMGSATGLRSLPPALRARLGSLDTAEPQTAATLPVTQHGTTYNLAQQVRWLDADHFAVGRWDATMSIFRFDTAPFVGPTITSVVRTPSSRGVQMLTPLPRQAIVTSNDGSSLALWEAHSSSWAGLRLRATVSYDPALGAATNGAWFPVGRPSTLVVGHESGYLSLWSFEPVTRALKLIKTVDVRNPDPVNPFGSHVMYGMCPLISEGPDATVVGGSDDGFVSIVRVPSGAVVSQTVFNPAAQRGINSVSVSGDKLLVANCSVGADDDNLWYFSVAPGTGALTLLDRMNLIIDTGRVQAFNFDIVWGRYAGGPCWFAGTEEGALWMGTADATLHLLGHQGLGDGAIGAALAYTGGSGRLAAVIHNLHQFTT